MSDEKKTTTAAADKAAAADEKMITSADIEAAEEDDDDSSYVVVFTKPFVWEDHTYTEIDLSNIENMKARDMIQVTRTLERSGSVNYAMPEMSMEYACIFAARATGMPVEFFEDLPPREAIRVKNKITNFFYGAD